jgi:serine/threonine protein phosphatase PrpC
VELSNDHKPFNDVEKARIEKAGGFVEDKRVNG